MRVGIDSFAVYVPRTYLALKKEWAKNRAEVFSKGNVENLVQKLEKGVGVTKVSIPDMHEDAATMAAMAVKKLLDDNGVSLSEIGYLAVATETAVDQSKSMASYILGMLEAYYGVEVGDIGCVEYKFACVSSAYALEAALALIASRRINKRYAIVVASDVAKYDLKTQGEYTQGAGAVAMLLCESPRLVEISDRPMGTYSRNDRDFYRPNWLLTPVVDGKYSLDVYCYAVYRAFVDFLSQTRDYTPRDLLLDIDHLLFHLPFPRMAEYATARLLLPFVQNLKWDEISKEELKKMEKEFVGTSKFKEFFEEKVVPSLSLSKEIGNVYTGSLYLALASLLINAEQRGKDLTGNRVVFCGYGSGASAKVFSGIFMSSWREAGTPVMLLNKSLDDIADGGERYPLSLADYERIHAKDKLKPDYPFWKESVITLKEEFALLNIGDGSKITDTGFRYYGYVK